jgi:hypothetical protein
VLNKYKTKPVLISVDLNSSFKKRYPKVSVVCIIIYLGRTTFDVADFFKLVIDWIVHQEVQESAN